MILHPQGLMQSFKADVCMEDVAAAADSKGTVRASEVLNAIAALTGGV